MVELVSQLLLLPNAYSFGPEQRLLILPTQCGKIDHAPF